MNATFCLKAPDPEAWASDLRKAADTLRPAFSNTDISLSLPLSLFKDSNEVLPCPPLSLRSPLVAAGVISGPKIKREQVRVLKTLLVGPYSLYTLLEERVRSDLRRLENWLQVQEELRLSVRALLRLLVFEKVQGMLQVFSL